MQLAAAAHVLARTLMFGASLLLSSEAAAMSGERAQPSGVLLVGDRF